MLLICDYPWETNKHWTDRYGPPTDASLPPLPANKEAALRQALDALHAARDTCAACGCVDDDMHQQRPHVFEDQDPVEVFRAALVEARR